MEFPIHTKKMGYRTERLLKPQRSKTNKPKKKKKKRLKIDWFTISKANKLKVLP
jgi:hypothetical protein